MNVFLWNIFLAVVWTFAVGEFRPFNFVVAFALGYAILWFAQPLVGPSRYFARVGQVTSFFFFFLWELVQANLRVAADVLTPGYSMRPGVMAIPLDAESDGEITLLANLITLTPGTLSLDVSKDRKTLYIHSMYIGDLEEDRRKVKDGFERRLLEVLR